MFRQWFWVGVLLLLTASPLEVQDQERAIKRKDQEMVSEQRVALVIGNADYDQSPLRNPVNDARDMAAELEKCGFRVLIYANLNREAMFKAVRNFGNNIKRGGVGLFYYSGHGIQVNGKNYLVPVDTDIEAEDEVAYKCLEMQLILDKMITAANRVNILILDACRNNTFGLKSKSLGYSSGLAEITKSKDLKGTFIAYATAPGDVALDGTGSNSPFTGALVEVMREPGLKIEEVFKLVRTKVRTATNQVPWTSSALEGDFYFVLPNSNSPQSPSPAVEYGHLQVIVKVPNVKVTVNGHYRGVANPDNPLKVREKTGPVDVIMEHENQTYLVRDTVWLNEETPIQLELLEEQGQKLNIYLIIGITGVIIYYLWLVFFLRNWLKKLCFIPFDTTVVFWGKLKDKIRRDKNPEGYGKTMRMQVKKSSSTKPFLTKKPPPAGKNININLPEGVKMEMVWINPGHFQMGSDPLQGTCNQDELPQHNVNISKGFWLGRYVVTQKQWKAVMGYMPTAIPFNFRNPYNPVTQISWDDVQNFIMELNTSMDTNVYRLPKEAEWEYACRAGTDSFWSFGNNTRLLTSQAWYDENTWNAGMRYVQTVGQKNPNSWGLYDMHGNVWEWVLDWYSDRYDVSADNVHRVVRGGSYFHNESYTRSAARSRHRPNSRLDYIGFRLLREAP